MAHSFRGLSVKKHHFEQRLDAEIYPALLVGGIGVIAFYLVQVFRGFFMTDDLLARLYLIHATIIIPYVALIILYIYKRKSVRTSGRLHAYGFSIAGLLIAAGLHTIIATADPSNVLGLLVIGLAAGCAMYAISWFALTFGLIVTTYVYVSWYYPNMPAFMNHTSTAYAAIVLTVVIFFSRRFSQIRILQAMDATGQASEALKQQLAAREAAESGLLEAEERLRFVMDQVPIGIFWKNADGCYLGCNQEFANNFDAEDANAIVGQTDHDIYNNGVITEKLARIEERVIQTGETAIDVLEQSIAPNITWTLHNESDPVNSTHRYVRFCRVPMHDSEGAAIGILGTLKDVTDEILTKFRESEMEQRLMNAQKFESLGALSGGIAHEFNNILVGVLGNADYIKMKLPETSNMHKNLDGVIESAQRASQLIQQMLMYSGRRELQEGRLNLNELILDMDGIIRASISKRHRVKYDLGQALPPFTADSGQIRQMIVNLLMNASESMGNRDGEIIVRTGTGTIDPAATDDEGLRRKSVFVEIADTGCGMDEETKARIFDPFYTTKFMGRGLGMSAVRGIVHVHDGVIQVESEPGEGTTVRVYLVIEEVEAESIETPMLGSPARDTQEAKHEGTVLLIDDEEMVIEVTSYMLESMGYKVATAQNGEDGLRTFDELRDELKCVIIDRTMPRMNGEKVVEAIRKRTNDIPIILCSGYSDEDLSDDIRNDRKTVTLGKPFQQSDLESSIQTLAMVE